MASIVKKNGWYYIKWYDIEGKQCWRRTGTKNKREAQELANGLSQEVRIQRKNRSSMKSGNTENIPLKILIDEFCKHLDRLGEQGVYSVNTIESYINYMQRFEAFLSGQGLLEQGIKALDKKQMTDYLDYQMALKPLTGNRDKLSADGIKLSFWIIGKFLDFISDENGLNVAVNRDIIKIPMPKTEKPKNSVPKHLTKEQVKYLVDLPVALKAKTAVRDRMAFLVFFNAGLRNAELLNLKVSDINFTKSQMSVIGKGNKHRIIPMTSTLSEELKGYIARNKLTDYIFLTMNGDQMQKGGYKKQLLRYEKLFLEKYPEVGHIHPHMFRHTAITLMLEAGIPVEVVKEIAGHTKISTTMIYTHVTQNRMSEEIRKYGI